MRFIARLQDGERMSDLCREFGISRKTGHKLKKRFAQQGPEGLFDQSRRPHHSPRKTSRCVVERVVALRKRHPTWGPKKLKQRLHDLEPEIPWPATSTIGVILKDEGLVDGRRRRRRASVTPLAERRESRAPNELWCIDYKGQFRMGNGRYCYPLTVSDHFSRYLLCCEALANVKAEPAAQTLEAVFLEYGLPEAIRSDNGAPFASVGRGGLTQLSAWLMRLGVRLERIDPGCPQQNGRHERMHKTLKQDATRPAKQNALQQQERFDDFRHEYNHERPHEALGMKTPGSVFTPSTRRLPDKLDVPEYPLHDDTRWVDKNGNISLCSRPVYVTKALVGQPLGIRLLEEGTWLISFMQLDLAYYDGATKKLIDLRNEQPSGAKV